MDNQYLLLGGVLLLGTLLQAGNLYADSCGDLQVNITNQSAKRCYLTDSALVSGTLSQSDVPKVIESGMSSLPFTISQSWGFGPNINLTYQCGTNTLITLQSKQSSCMVTTGTISGTVTESKNLSAFNTYLEGDIWSARHGELSWTIKG